METTFVIYIGIFKTLGIIVTFVGSLLWGAWYIASRLTKVETKVEGFDTRLTNFEGKQSNVFASASPISLKPIGVEALEGSGLKKWIDDHKNELLTHCARLNNPYDIQESVFKQFDQLDFGNFEAQLKQTAFSYGWSIETMRRVGGIYFRDVCLKEHGFTPEDLDKPKL